MTGATYDAAALIAAERGDPAMWAFHRAALRRGWVPVIPAPVLAQAWRGGPQASLSRLLQGCRVEAFDEAQARFAGTLCAASGTSDIVDAAVVASAARRRDAIVTRDELDLQRLVDVTGIDLPLVWPD